VIIFMGAILLTLPISSKHREFTPFVDSLFTATSATCVTGLVVYDTYSHWSVFGQLVLLLLIQIGGLGFVTMSIAIVTFTKRKISFSQRLVAQESIASTRHGGIVKMSRFAVAGAILVELVGALLLSVSFIPKFGFLKGLYYSVFHSVSAFCNAGFDLMGEIEPRSSLVSFNTNPLILLTIGFLIIIGGLGFFVWSDIKDYKLKFKKYSLHSKLVLTTTAGLLIGGTFFFLILEYNKPTYEGLSFFSKVLNSFFQAVTPRTAGFNSVDIGIMTEASLLVTVFLMLVGGSSGSTAGGIKTTTFAVLILNILSVSRRRDSLQVFRRRIDESTLRSSVTIVSVYVFLLLTSTLIISAIENLPVIDTLFESASAIATVGLTTGITDKIGSISKIILTFLMYFGRVGCLTLIYAITISAGPQYSKLPAEKIAVG